MMQVTNVKVGFSRLRRPADFEHQNPSVEFSATLDPGDSHEAAARTLMIDAVGVSYNALGYGVPDKIAQALASGVVPDGGTVEATTEEATQEASEAAEKPKPRGRKPGSKNTRPKKNTKAAAEAEAEQKAAIEAAAAEANNADSIPDDGEDTVEANQLADEKAAGAVGMDDADSIPDDGDERPKDQISTNPEDRVDPDADDIPDDGPAEAPANTVETIEFTAQDLNAMIGKLLNEQRVTLKDAKSITRHFQVARVHDLDATQVIEARNMLEEIMEARKKDD
jgi:hypothetical protein